MKGSLVVKYGDGKKGAKELARDVEASHGADTGTLSTRVDLCSNMAEFKKVRDYVAEVRKWWRERSAVWEDGGSRVFKAMASSTIEAYMSQASTQFYKLAQDAVNAYPAYVQNRLHEVGTLVTQDAFWTVEEFMAKFTFNFTTEPLPDRDDFRVIDGLTKQEAEAFGQRMVDESRARVEAAMGETRDKLTSVLDRLVGQLENKTKQEDGDDSIKRAPITKSSLEALWDAIKAVPGLNIAGHPGLDAMASELEHALDGVTVDALKDDRATRDRVASVTKSVSESLKSMLSDDSLEHEAESVDVCGEKAATLKASLQDMF
jgi:hypothetical protein